MRIMERDECRCSELKFASIFCGCVGAEEIIQGWEKWEETDGKLCEVGSK